MAASEVLDRIFERHGKLQMISNVRINRVWSVAHDLISCSNRQEEVLP